MCENNKNTKKKLKQSKKLQKYLQMFSMCHKGKGGNGQSHCFDVIAVQHGNTVPSTQTLANPNPNPHDSNTTIYIQPRLYPDYMALTFAFTIKGHSVIVYWNRQSQLKVQSLTPSFNYQMKYQWQ